MKVMGLHILLRHLRQRGPSLVLMVLVIVTSLLTVHPVTASPPPQKYHSPIAIDGNGNFTGQNGVTSGNGTESDPYVIEGWIVSVCCQTPGILIQNTSAYFVIRNVHVFSSDWYFYGVNMTNVDNGAIEKSQFTDYLWSLTIDSSVNILISDDVINLVNIDSSENVTVSGSGPGRAWVTSSDNITLVNNTFSGLPLGVSIIDSTEVTVQNNTLSQIWLGETSSEQLDSVTITPDNTANGQPLLF